MTKTERIAELEARLAELEAKVALLEARSPSYTLTAATGYQCGICLEWVPINTAHSCAAIQP